MCTEYTSECTILRLSVSLFAAVAIQAELCPMSCTGGKFDLIKIPMVTLIDTLDTLVILGNYSGMNMRVWI